MDRRILVGALASVLLSQSATAKPIASRQVSMTNGVKAVFSKESGQPTVYGITVPFTFTKADAGKMLELVAESPRPVTIEMWSGTIPESSTNWSKGRKFLGNSGAEPTAKPSFQWMVEPGTYTALIVTTLPAGERPEPFRIAYGKEVREATAEDKARWEKAVADHDLGRIRAKQAQRTPAPRFTAMATDRNPISLAQYRGKVVLLFFWSGQEAAGKDHFAFVNDLTARYKSEGLETIGIYLDTDPTAINEALATLNPTWRQVYDERTGNEALAQRFDVNGWLGTYLIDATGRIISRDQFGEELRKAVVNALYENQILADALESTSK